MFNEIRIEFKIKLYFKSNQRSAGCVIFELIFLEKFRRVSENITAEMNKQVLPGATVRRLAELLKMYK